MVLYVIFVSIFIYMYVSFHRTFLSLPHSYSFFFQFFSIMIYACGFGIIPSVIFGSIAWKQYWLALFTGRANVMTPIKRKSEVQVTQVMS
jgi:hypothetical protein